MPDFDIDFCQERRDEVIDYVQAQVRQRPRRPDHHLRLAAGAARCCATSAGCCSCRWAWSTGWPRWCRNNPANPITLAKAIEIEPRLQQAHEPTRRASPSLLEIALQLEGLYRNASTHAAGVVIGDRPLTELVPLYRDPRSDMPATQFNMKWVESAGLVKFDFLGLKTLTVIDRAVKLPAAARRRASTLDQLPLDDAATYELIRRGADGRRVPDGRRRACATWCASSSPRRIEDIIALVALYRPGPMDSIDDYVDAQVRPQAGRLSCTRCWSRCSSETYGVIVYQEQVMQIARILAGYTPGRGRPAAPRHGQEEEGGDGPAARPLPRGRGRARASSRGDGREIFELMAKFAGYGFNKCHAAAYALIAYQTAWLKAQCAGRVLRRLDEPRHLQHRQAGGVLSGRAAERGRDPPSGREPLRRRLRGRGRRGALRPGRVRNVGLAAMEHLVAVREEGGQFARPVRFRASGSIRARSTSGRWRTSPAPAPSTACTPTAPKWLRRPIC